MMVRWIETSINQQGCPWIRSSRSRGSLPVAAACAVSGFGFEVVPSFPGLG